MADIYHYDRDSLVAALQAAGLTRGDIVLCHVSLGRLGFAKEGRSMEALSELLVAAMDDVLGPEGTLLIPTYSYSIGRGEVFDPDETPARIGEFPEWFRTQPGVRRSEEPMLAISGRGPATDTLFYNLPPTSYGENSVYHRLRERGGKICTIGLGLYWATFRHHIEEIAGVPYRFRKEFSGQIRNQTKRSSVRWVYSVAPRQTICEPSGERLALMAAEAGLVTHAPVGRSGVNVIDAERYFQFGVSALQRDPWLAAKGPGVDLDTLVALETARIGEGVGVDLRSDFSETQPLKSILADMDDWLLPALGAGVDAFWMRLFGTEGYVPKYFYSGDADGPMLIPERWTCRNVEIRTGEGTVVLSGPDASSAVIPYSHAFEGALTRGDLIALHGCDDSTDAMVQAGRDVVTQRTWKMQLPNVLRDGDPEEILHVAINTDTGFGRLSVAERRFAGPTDGPHLIVAGILGTHRLSGVAAVLDFANYMNDRGGPKTGQLTVVIAPPGFGLAAWVDSYLTDQAATLIVVGDAGVTADHDISMSQIDKARRVNPRLEIIELSNNGLKSRSFGDTTAAVVKELIELAGPIVGASEAERSSNHAP